MPLHNLHALFLAYDFFRFVSWPLVANDKSCLHLPRFCRQSILSCAFHTEEGGKAKPNSRREDNAGLFNPARRGILARSRKKQSGKTG